MMFRRATARASAKEQNPITAAFVAGGVVVIFGASTALSVDVEESCARLGVHILALVQNRDGKAFALDTTRLRHLRDLGPDAVGAAFICPLFTPANRKIGVKEALAFGFVPAPALVDPTVIAARSTTIGEGSFVNAGCLLAAAGTIGRFVVINRGANIGHHANIVDYASIGPGVVMAGEITIGPGAMLGTGAVIGPGVCIGEGSAIAPGAVITRDVLPHHLAAGNPMRLQPRRKIGTA